MNSKQKSAPQQQAAPAYKPVAMAQFNPEQAQGVGWNPVPQTFTQEAKPAWMQGWFDMPSWGMDAATGQPLGQEQLQAQAYQPPEQQAPAPAPQQAPSWGDPRMQYDLFKRQMDWESRRDNMRQQDGIGWGTMDGMFNPAFDPIAKWERQQNRMQRSGLADQMAQQDQERAARQAAVWSQLPGYRG